MVDDNQELTIPFHIFSKEFFADVINHLNPQDTMVSNMNMYANDKGGLNDYLCGTIKDVFFSVYTIETNSSNMEILASNGFDCKDKPKENITSTQKSDLKNFMSPLPDRMKEVVASDYILTDDKAPVELLGMGP